MQSNPRHKRPWIESPGSPVHGFREWIKLVTERAKPAIMKKMEIPERGGPVERLKNAHIEGIQNEYRRINAKWLQMHYRLLLWLALFTAFMEIVMFFVLGRIDAITASNTVYLVKYLLIPSACNLTICAAAVLFIKSP